MTVPPFRSLPNDFTTELTMGYARAGKALVISLMIVAVLTVGGCMGGSRNVAPEGQAGTSTGSTSSSGAASRWAGKDAPDFALKSLDGTIVRLSDFKGKNVLINFWATWCPPCKEEMPDIERAYQKYKDQGWVFLGIDMKEDAETVRKYVQGKYNWTFLMDSEGRAASSYLVTGVPETYFVDREGKVRDYKIGGLTFAEFDSRISRIK